MTAGEVPASRRWAIFCGSIVSAIDNPDAYLLQALGRQLHEWAHPATFFEERANPAVRALLLRHGATALDAFQRANPEIVYRTEPPRVGADLVESLVRTLSTVDIALVAVGAPATVAAWVGRLTRPHLATFLLDSGWNEPLSPSEAELRDPTTFSGILVGRPEARATWAAVDPQRVHEFGPLPPRDEITRLAPGSAVERLRSDAGELAGLIVALLAGAS